MDQPISNVPDRTTRKRFRKAAFRSVLRAASVAILVFGAYYLAPVKAGSDVGATIRIICVGVATGLVIAWEIRAVAGSEFPRLRALDALVSSVSVMVIAFAITYLNMSHRHPDSFNELLGRTSSLYFTVTTLATVGYGDIYAKTDEARIAVMIQMVFNVAVIGTTVKAILGTARQRGGRPFSTPGA
jgi:voltage-gated potassium channel